MYQSSVPKLLESNMYVYPFFHGECFATAPAACQVRTPKDFNVVTMSAGLGVLQVRER